MKVRALVLASVLVLAGCSGGDEPEPDPLESSSSGGNESGTDEGEEPEEPALEPAHVVQTVYFGNEITMSVYPIQAHGQQLLAQVDMELAPGAEEVDLTWALSRSSTLAAADVSYLRLIDRPAQKLYGVATDDADTVAGTNDASQMTLAPDGEPVSLFAYFEGTDAQSLDLFLPLLGYVADIPVTQIDDPSEFSAPLSEFGVGENIASEVYNLSTRLVDYDETSKVQEDDEKVNWSLSSDVLFDYGEHKLDKEAKKTIEETIEEIKELALEDGEIHLVGHTDDQGSASFNQDLSEKRATSVQKVFEEKFPESYKITSEGKGKTQPAVEGTSEDARKANRRVEVQFVAKEDVEIARRSKGEIPDTEAPTVSGNEQMEFEYGQPGSGKFVGLRMVSVTELDPENLLGTIEVELLDGFDGGGEPLTALFSRSGGMSDGRGGRSVDAYTLGGGTGLLTLATAGGSLYPLEYVTGETGIGTDLYDVVGDTRPMGAYAQGDVYNLSVVWPNPGTDTVTVEVVDRMRFEDVPVQ